MTEVTERPKHDLENGGTWTSHGVIPYEWMERYCICREAGMSDKEARQVAAEDYRRAQSARMGHGGR